MDTAIIIVFVGLLVFLAHLFSTIFSKTKFPDVLLLIVVAPNSPLVGKTLKHMKFRDAYGCTALCNPPPWNTYARVCWGDKTSSRRFSLD